MIGRGIGALDDVISDVMADVIAGRTGNLGFKKFCIPVIINIKGVFPQNVKRKFYAETFAAMQPNANLPIGKKPGRRRGKL